MSFALQKKNISIQDALCAVDAAKAYFKRIRSVPVFNRFYDATVKISKNYSIRKPELPRYRRCPVRFDEGSFSNQFPDPRAYFRHTYYEVCDLLSGELENRFSDQRISSVMSIEHTFEGC